MILHVKQAYVLPGMTQYKMALCMMKSYVNLITKKTNPKLTSKQHETSLFNQLKYNKHNEANKFL